MGLVRLLRLMLIDAGNETLSKVCSSATMVSGSGASPSITTSARVPEIIVAHDVSSSTDRANRGKCCFFINSSFFALTLKRQLFENLARLSKLF